MTASFVMVKTARDALYFSGGGLESLPQAYLAIAILALPMAMATLGILNLVGARRGRWILPAAFALALPVIAPAMTSTAHGPLATLFFVLVPLTYGVLFSIGWLLAARLLEGTLYEARAEAYRWIGVASILGGAIGGLVAQQLAGALGTRGILLAGSAALLASAGVMAWAQFRYLQASSAARAPGPKPGSVTAWVATTKGMFRVGGQAYVQRLARIAMAAAATGVLVEFLFYLLAASAPRSAEGNARFFGSAYLLMHAGALVLQLVLYRPLQRRIGVSGLLLALPLVLFGGASTLLLGATMLFGQGLKIAEGGIKQSVHRSSWEQAFLPIAPADRGIAKLVVEGAGARLAEGLTASMLLVWTRFALQGRMPGPGDAATIGVVLVGSSLLWAHMANSMRRDLHRHARANPGDRCRPDSPLPDG